MTLNLRYAMISHFRAAIVVQSMAADSHFAMEKERDAGNTELASLLQQLSAEQYAQAQASMEFYFSTLDYLTKRLTQSLMERLIQ